MYYDVEIKDEANPSLLPGALVIHSVLHSNRKQTKTAGHLNHFWGSGSITEEEGGRLYEREDGDESCNPPSEYDMAILIMSAQQQWPPG